MMANNYTSDYFTKYFYPRLELDSKLIDAGRDYFNELNKKLKLDVYFVITTQLPARTLGQYRSLWRQINSPDDKFGEILIDVEKHKGIEDLFHTIRHEICHAVCDLRYNLSANERKNCHGAQWKKLAKLFRVDIKQYEN